MNVNYQSSSTSVWITLQLFQTLDTITHSGLIFVLVAYKLRQFCHLIIPHTTIPVNASEDLTAGKLSYINQHDAGNQSLNII